MTINGLTGSVRSTGVPTTLLEEYTDYGGRDSGPAGNPPVTAPPTPYEINLSGPFLGTGQFASPQSNVAASVRDDEDDAPFFGGGTSPASVRLPAALAFERRLLGQPGTSAAGSPTLDVGVGQIGALLDRNHPENQAHRLVAQAIEGSTAGFRASFLPPIPWWFPFLPGGRWPYPEPEIPSFREMKRRLREVWRDTRSALASETKKGPLKNRERALFKILELDDKLEIFSIVEDALLFTIDLLTEHWSKSSATLEDALELTQNYANCNGTMGDIFRNLFRNARLSPLGPPTIDDQAWYDEVKDEIARALILLKGN